MQSIKEDDLLDYNELEQEQIMSLGQHANDNSSGPRETPSPAPDFNSHSPKQTLSTPNSVVVLNDNIVVLSS